MLVSGLWLFAAYRPLFTIAPDSPPAKFNARDNAVGAVSRLIYKNTAAVPLDQVLPVLLSAVPLTQDYLENRPLFRAIFHLFSTQPQILHPHLDRLLQLFAHVLEPMAPDQIGDEIRADLIKLVTALNAEEPAKVQAAGLAAFVVGA